MGIKTHITRLEKPDTGEIFDIWMNVETVIHPDTNDTPGYVEENIVDWGIEESFDKPEWITTQMLLNNLNSIELDEGESYEYD